MLLHIPQEAVSVEVTAREVAPGVRLHLNLQAGRILKDIMFQQLVCTPTRCLRHTGGCWDYTSLELSLWQANLDRMQQSKKLQGNSCVGRGWLQSCDAEGSSPICSSHHPTCR